MRLRTRARAAAPAGAVRRLAAMALTVVACSAGWARPIAAQTDLDAFMSQVLARRDENWRKLRQYVLDEREAIDVLGPGQTRLWGDRRDYTWFIRDGFFIRSPTRANGVAVPEGERRRYEDEFLRRARARERGGAAAAAPAMPAPATVEGVIGQTRQPEFIDAAYFLRFTFEAGKYTLVGRETLDGQPVLRIEYYPARLFNHEEDAERRRRASQRRDHDKDMDASIERMMNKVSLVTLWVEPNAHQIVKYTFDNIDLDFLPGAWLIRLDNLRATMTMEQAFPSVWLPHDINMEMNGTLAAGTVDVRYHLDYHDYREATTSGRLVPPGGR